MHNFHPGDDDDQPAGNGATQQDDEQIVEAGDYDPGDEIGTRIGEHDEDPSL